MQTGPLTRLPTPAPPRLPRPLCRHVTEDDFDVGGPLHHVQMELLLWASYRGQLLSRTVRGEGAPSWGQPPACSAQALSAHHPRGPIQPLGMHAHAN